MKTTLTFLAALGAVIAIGSLPVAAATSSATVNLATQNNSGESGTATLTQSGSDVTVVISLTGAPATAQPAHIHSGTCASLGGPAYPLTNIVNGASTTTLKGTTVDALLKGPFAINVHASTDDMGKYVACGNVTSSSSSM